MVMCLRNMGEVYAFIVSMLFMIDKASCQTNVALGATVTMSSQYVNPPDVPPSPGSNAVDGNNSTDWWDGGCASTEKEKNSWMLFDFGSIYTVTGMKIFNRYDVSHTRCCPNRLRGFTVSVGQNETSLTDIYTHSGTFPIVAEITFEETYDIEYLKISMPANDYLTICELEVYEDGLPVNGSWSDWSDWSECSPTCGESATRSMSRTCTNPAPRNGGADCDGDAVETEDCTVAVCPVDGGWSEFGDWSSCLSSCGSGLRVRSRTCTNPEPSGGGADCVGSATEAEICDNEPCPATAAVGCSTNSPAANCEDIRVNLLQTGNQAISGEYTIVPTAGQEVAVYCDFYNDIGRSYTFLSTSAIETINTATLKTLYNRKDHVMARLLFENGQQREIEVGQLSSFAHKYPLSVQINGYQGYSYPVNYGVSSFLYLGFQPVEAAPISTPDKTYNPLFGYKGNGVDYKFLNCNQTAKGFVAFFTDSTAFQNSPYYLWFNEIYPEGLWVLDHQLIAEHRYLPTSYYMEYEFRMGGCGGYATSMKGREMNIVGATIGLPTDYNAECPTEPVPM